MDTAEVSYYLNSAWQKIAPEQDEFIDKLYQQLCLINEDEGVEFRLDRVAICELWLTLVSYEFSAKKPHWLDVLSLLSADSKHGCASLCLLFSAAINMVLQSMSLDERLSHKEHAAFASISQLLCADCIKRIRNDVTIINADDIKFS